METAANHDLRSYMAPKRKLTVYSHHTQTYAELGAPAQVFRTR